MLGRRGPVQAAFTPPELKELGELAGADVIVDPEELRLDAASEHALEDDRERARRNYELLGEFADGRLRASRAGSCCASSSRPSRSSGTTGSRPLRWSATSSWRKAAAWSPRPTGEMEVIPAGLVLRSVGYQGVALPGVPFDERKGTIPNDRGRVEGAERTYVAGWIKRGPSGVIGTNKKDATETVELLLEDARAGRLARGVNSLLLDQLLEEKGARYVDYAGWQAIDAVERGAGEPLGRPRVKLTGWEKLLETGERRAASY